MYRRFHRQLITFSILNIAFLSTVVGIGAGETLPIPPILESETLSDGTRVFNIEAQEGSREFFDNKTTRTLGYNGDYLGPTIRAKRDENIVVRIKNSLDDPTTFHWHGADVPAEADGGPHQVIASGETRAAEFRIQQNAATLWYHPHFMGTTGKQVYEGLAGLFIIDDEISDSLNLPDNYGVDDIPVILQERDFANNGTFRYRPTMPDVMHGYFGNQMLVNGAVSPYKEVPRGPVRLRLLNGSNSTLLKITFGDFVDLYQIATDGGFTESPVPVKFVILSPGERVELIADFSLTDESTIVMMADTNGQQKYEAMEFRLIGSRQPSWEVPDTLVEVEDIPESESDETRYFVMQSGMGARMTINGKVMSMSRVDERLKLGDTEIWDIENRDGMMSQPHSFHVHQVQFRILDINGQPPPEQLDGWKDTVLLWPGDRVRIIARFDSYRGLYMYHCHLLEHEDNGMMGQFLIE